VDDFDQVRLRSHDRSDSQQIGDSYEGNGSDLSNSDK
jgi:hypothetical protein